MVRVIFTSDLCVAILAGTVLPPEIGTARPPIHSCSHYFKIILIYVLTTCR